MKVYSTPVPFADPDYSKYDSAVEQKREADHQEQIKAWLLANGYAGPRTGEIANFPKADGYASYMYGDGRSPCLIHLPYGDAYHEPMVQHLPKSEVIAALDRAKSLASTL